MNRLFFHDVRYALRQLRKSPGFAVTAILTLALGVGANVVVFSVLNALVLRPLNVPQPKSLYNIARKPHDWDTESYPDYLDYRNRNSTFSGIAAYNFEVLGLSKGTLVTKSFGYEVSGNYFDMLGIQPARGRFFHASDEHGPNSAPYIVLSDDFWRNHFNRDPHIIDETVDLNKHPYTVLGIAPRTFHGTEIFMWPDFWVPMVNEQQLDGYNYLVQRSNHVVWLLGRLKPGVTVQQATDNLDAIASRLAKQYPSEDDGLAARLLKPGLMGDGLGKPVRNFLTGIMVLALLVLLAACANLGSIFAARAADRSREMAIRLAVGSSRMDMLRQLLTESVVVSLLGGIAGTFFAAALLQALSRWQPFVAFSVHVPVAPDLRVYAVALLLSLGSGILFGLLPARQIWRTDAAQVMKSGTGTAATFRRFTLRDALLLVQIALCTLLVTASLVAVRGMQHSLHAPLGIQPQGVTLATADLEMGGYSNGQSLPVQKRMIEEAARIPGVTAVGTIGHAPPNVQGGDEVVYRKGTADFRLSNAVLDAKYYPISPGYLHAAETQLLTGRDFTWHDDAKAPKVAIVNETFARTMFGKSSAIGKPFLLWGGTPVQIVGVVQNGKYNSLTENPLPAMFFPVAQNTNSDTTLVVRSHLTPAEIAADLNRVLTGIAPDLPFTIQSWSDALALIYFPAQAAAAALGIMGLLAAMLAVTGIFGMAAYSVSKRMKELGIRVALGAQPVQLMRSAFTRPLTLLLCGSVAGLLLGILASRLLAQIVYEATPSDPLVMGGVIVTMTLLGLLATWIPARRALTLDPAKLLREE
ncbi:MAG TPA: ABC transporter permease [Acidobacteriaceae bacterium]|jgi:predicted permease|nr:ABC transporter permease [Acidobacteriaceae bacterium]